MMLLRLPFLILLTSLNWQSCFVCSASAAEITFSRDVLPVLSDRCFHCHGPDAGNREADLRLDVEADAKADRGGYRAIVPGSPEKSALWQRIVSEDELERMPPADSHRKPLTDAERQAILQWIEEGATWGQHWAFDVPVRPAIPPTAEHPIDAFVRYRLLQDSLDLSPRAPMHQQIRRLALDLTGMSATESQVRSVAAEPTDENWRRLADELLESPHHAERMAMWWLDAARYSDSDGFQGDATRQNWPWRDWVIRAFQNNMSFDQFTIQQFAGDLLPSATPDQILATCFHRNHMTNGEGGRHPEESRIDYVIDRVNTMGTVWMGLTLGCVQCHSHKFDPISQHDYYSLSAFFNSIDEDGKAGMAAKPYLKVSPPEVADRIVELEQFTAECRQRDAQAEQEATRRFDQWLSQVIDSPPDNWPVWWNPKPQVSAIEGTQFDVETDGTVQAVGPMPRQDDYRVEFEIPAEMRRVTGWSLQVLPHDDHVNGRFTRDGNGEFALTSVRLLAKRQDSPAEQELEMSGAIADYERDVKKDPGWDARYSPVAKTLNDDARDGWTTSGAVETEPHTAVYALQEPWSIQTGDRLIFVLRFRATRGRASIGRFRIAIAQEYGETVHRVDGASPMRDWLQQRPVKVPADDLRKRLRTQYLLGDALYQADHLRLVQAEKQLRDLRNEQKPRSVMVLKERAEPRSTHVLERGVWDAKGDTVLPRVLPTVLEWPADRTQSRLDLAHWLVDRQNPLTARVVVNHLWQMVFGSGLVRTPEDFGVQGEFPTHPDLLDWLAVELMEHDWDLRHILRLMVTSDTYRQSSRVTAELRKQDPENRLLARAPRFRLPSWMIRDNALRVSGLLNPAVGGPPVKPWQPKGVWAENTMGRFRYNPSVGPAQYRRTLYGFWRRSSAPTFLFDSAQRRVCEVGVRRTNTPLHALTLMNNIGMLEAARVLADDMVEASATAQGQSSTEAGLQRLADRIVQRSLGSEEIRELSAVWTSAQQYYRTAESDALTYTTVGQQDPPAAAVAAETAAWMSVSALFLNLDEAMSRE